MGAFIVGVEEDSKLPKYRNDILSEIKSLKRDIHFSELSHEQRIVVCRKMRNIKYGSIVVLSNKLTIIDNPKKEVLSKKGFLYNLLTRYLIERISYVVKGAAERDNVNPHKCLKIIFSRRRNTDYNKMKNYLQYLKDGKEKITPKQHIDWSVVDFDLILDMNHKKYAGLQFADVVSGSFYSAFDPGKYEIYEIAYANELKYNLISKYNLTIDYGLKLVPSINKNPLNDKQMCNLEMIIKSRPLAHAPIEATLSHDNPGQLQRLPANHIVSKILYFFNN